LRGLIGFVLFWATGLAVGVALVLLLTGSGTAWLSIGLVGAAAGAVVLLRNRKR
jgi:hypothetical protein